MPVTRHRAPSDLGRARGLTLIEVMTALAIVGAVSSSLYMLLGAGIKGYLIEHARVTDQQQARRGIASVANAVRQANADPQAICPEGFLLTGSGNGFPQRLAVRAILDERPDQARQTYVYYVEGRTLWQETLAQETAANCGEEATRTEPDSARIALSPPIVGAFELSYLDRNGVPTSTPALVRSVRITLTVEGRSIARHLESETYQATVTARGP